MPLAKILVAFCELPDVQTAVETIGRAVAMAGSPNGLSFAVGSGLERGLAQAAARGAPIDPASLSFYNDANGLEGLASLGADDSYFLFLTGAYDFEPKWDITLLNRFGKIPEKNAVMTGCIGAAEEAVPPQPYLPALAENFQENGVLLERGLPLVCSAAPVRTLVIDPALIFGRRAFLSQVETQRETLSIAAYVAGVPVYALDRAALWPIKLPKETRLQRPVAEALPGTTLARFEQLAGFHYDQKRAGVRTTWGLFAPENSYPQQLPNRLAAAQRARALFAFAKRSRTPLLATAFIDLPAPSKPIPVYMLRFEYLKALVNLPLTLYTGGGQERLLRASFPNARSYPDNSLLPKTPLQKGMTKEQWMQRNKLLLLAKTARQHPDFTHVAWVNIDTLKHPVCPQAAPDFTAMMDDRVHLATVNAIPDASFILTPVRLLRALCQEVTDITQLDGELKRSFTEVALIQRLYQRHPDWFALHPMPKKHLLFLTAFDPALLDQRYQTLLFNQKPVVRAQPAAAKELSK